ncbi:MAG: ATP-binding protein [Vicinamibacterales bacterium]|nr:ATP-binding protein [Vicinamibacterales bacterium]
MRSTPLSFRARLTIRWTVVFSCVLAAASVAIFAGIRSTSYTDLDNHLRTLAGTEVTSAIDNPTTPPHVHELPVTALAGGTFTQKFVQILDESGRIVAAAPGQAEAVPLAEPSQLTEALAGGAPVSTREVAGVPVRVVVLRAAAQGRMYTIAVGVAIGDLLAGLRRVQWLLVVVWLVSTATTAAVGFALASTALTPVRRITQRALDIASRDIRERLEPSEVKDEIGLMAEALNALIGRLHVALDANRRFAADAAHELRSPVTAIAGEIEVALRRERTAAEYRETLNLVQDRLVSLSALMADLVLLVRAQEGTARIRPQELSMQSVLDVSLAKMQPLAAVRGIALHCDDLSGLHTYGEPGLLGRVLDNVLENAIRYNREGGRIAIGATVEDAVADGWTPGFVTLRVTDSGSGIPDADHERVFERFYRVDQSRARHTGGAGLGLAIAREVLALFNGTICIERSSADGTTVAMRVPGRRHMPTGHVEGAVGH